MTYDELEAGLIRMANTVEHLANIPAQNVDRLINGQLALRRVVLVNGDPQIFKRLNTRSRCFRWRLGSRQASISSGLR